MKYLTEFRNGEIAQRMAREIAAVTTRPWKIMEVCGGQTHSIIKNGIDQMLPAGIEMIHGPGCPVCVTPLELIDKALAIAAQPGVIFCSFGDMLRVPGTEGDLFQVKGAGGDVRVVYSPLDAVEAHVEGDLVAIDLTLSNLRRIAHWAGDRSGQLDAILLEGKGDLHGVAIRANHIARPGSGHIGCSKRACGGECHHQGRAETQKLFHRTTS